MHPLDHYVGIRKLKLKKQPVFIVPTPKKPKSDFYRSKQSQIIDILTSLKTWLKMKQEKQLQLRHK